MSRPTDPSAEVQSVPTPLGLERPEDVLDREDWSRADKIAVLEQWEQDLREQMVAEEEAMPGATPSLGETLSAVLRSLDRLGGAEHRTPVPTKHG